MSIKKISKTDFAAMVNSIITEQKVFGVQAKGEKYDFGPLASADALTLDYDVTLSPAKKFFQPVCETLMTFEVAGESQSCYDTEPFVLIGVHPYDMIALNQMDEIFSQDNKDMHYFTRREHATIVALDVVRPSKNVFASVMDTAVVKEGFDILLTDIGDSYVAQAATEKGEALLEKANGTDASDDDLQNRQEIWENSKKVLNKHDLKCDKGDLGNLLSQAYDHKVWEERAKTCFGCGSCNQVCPTCYCFNVCDDVSWDLKTGSRDRSWDGCLLNGFTKVAGEHEFRNNKADRFRHRLYRKAKYVPEKINGQIACVGCGRCIGACLPDIANPINVYNELLEDIAV